LTYARIPSVVSCADGFVARAGIYHLHCEGVIHRDIAARNVMIGPDYSVFVGDFGFARLKEKGAAYAKTKSSLGPVKYMSPESIKEKKYSEKTDAYSFAVLMWEVRTDALSSSSPPTRMRLTLWFSTRRRS
jgi:serine/threonine protein kinase